MPPKSKSGHIIIWELIILLILSSVMIKKGMEYDAAMYASLYDSEKKFIKWVNFDVTKEAMDRAYRYDVETWNSDVHLNWIELLAYLGAKYGGDFSRYKEKHMTDLANKLLNKEETMESLTKDMKYYSYYLEAYTAVLGGMVGEYKIEVKDAYYNFKGI